MTAVHVLHIGDTKVPFGQFYGGSDGEWLGLRAIAKFLGDKAHYMLVPIYTFLIEHPVYGCVLVDTGINWEQATTIASTTTGSSYAWPSTRTSTSSSLVSNCCSTLRHVILPPPISTSSS
jgi:hypothetical protein